MIPKASSISLTWDQFIKDSFVNVCIQACGIHLNFLSIFLFTCGAARQKKTFPTKPKHSTLLTPLQECFFANFWQIHSALYSGQHFENSGFNPHPDLNTHYFHLLFAHCYLFTWNRCYLYIPLINIKVFILKIFDEINIHSLIHQALDVTSPK